MADIFEDGQQGSRAVFVAALAALQAQGQAVLGGLAQTGSSVDASLIVSKRGSAHLDGPGQPELKGSGRDGSTLCRFFLRGDCEQIIW